MSTFWQKFEPPQDKIAKQSLVRIAFHTVFLIVENRQLTFLICRNENDKNTNYVMKNNKKMCQEVTQNY